MLTWVQALWPDGVFITRHPTRGQSSPVNPGLSHSTILERRRKEGEQRGKLAPLTFEQRREAARRAMVVRGLIFGQFLQPMLSDLVILGDFLARTASSYVAACHWSSFRMLKTTEVCPLIDLCDLDCRRYLVGLIILSNDQVPVRWVRVVSLKQILCIQSNVLWGVPTS